LFQVGGLFKGQRHLVLAGITPYSVVKAW